MSSYTYIINLRKPGKAKTEELRIFLSREQMTRYFNPKWIKGMKEEGYAGAKEIKKFVEYQWGFDVTNPDIITEDTWNKTYKVYMLDEYNLDLKDFFDKSNLYAYQSITARMLETARKGYWHPSGEVLRSLAKEYAESVSEYGVTCCHHTCANPFVHEFIAGILSAPGIISSGTAMKYNEAVLSAAGERGVESEELIKVGKIVKEVKGPEVFPISGASLLLKFYQS